MDIPASLKTGSTISAKSFRAVPFPPIGLIIKRTCLGRFVSANGYFWYTWTNMCKLKISFINWIFGNTRYVIFLFHKGNTHIFWYHFWKYKNLLNFSIFFYKYFMTMIKLCNHKFNIFKIRPFMLQFLKSLAKSEASVGISYWGGQFYQ